MNQLFIAVRIDDINPVHTRLTIFSGWKYSAETLGNSGSLVLDTPAAAEFVFRLNPVRVSAKEGVELPDWAQDIGYR